MLIRRPTTLSVRRMPPDDGVEFPTKRGTGLFMGRP